MCHCDFISGQVIDTVAFQRSIDSFNRPYRSELDAKDKLLLKKVADYKEALDKLNGSFITDIQKEFDNPDNDYFILYMLTDSLRSIGKENALMYDIIMDNIGIKRPDRSGYSSMQMSDMPVNFAILSGTDMIENITFWDHILKTDYLVRKKIKEENLPYIARFISNKLPYCISTVDAEQECFCKGIDKIDKVILDKLIDKIKENKR